MSRNDLQVNFRMPSGLKQALSAAADANKRSLTAELQSRLETSFQKEGGSVESGASNASGENTGTVVDSLDAGAVIALLLSLDKKVNALCTHLGIDGEKKDGRQ